MKECEKRIIITKEIAQMQKNELREMRKNETKFEGKEMRIKENNTK